MPREEKPRTFKVNEGRIYANKFYPYYFTQDLKVNVVPISYYTRYQARFTLSKQFGNWKDLFHIASGRQILERGWTLGKNSIRVNGKSYQIKKYYIPLEYATNRSRRRSFQKRLRKVLKIGKRSQINQFLKTYYFHAI